MNGRTDPHFVETLQNRLNAMPDEHDVVGNRFRVWADETTVQGSVSARSLNMRTRRTSGQIE